MKRNKGTRKRRYHKGPENPAAFFRKLDKKVLELSSTLGSDNTSPHEISFWMYLPEEERAYTLATTLQREGFEVDVSPPTPGDHRDLPWLCLAYRNMIPDPDVLEAVRDILVPLVELYGGKFDGWEMGMSGEA